MTHSFFRTMDGVLKIKKILNIIIGQAFKDKKFIKKNKRKSFRYKRIKLNFIGMLIRIIGMSYIFRENSQRVTEKQPLISLAPYILALKDWVLRLLLIKKVLLSVYKLYKII